MRTSRLVLVLIAALAVLAGPVSPAVADPLPAQVEDDGPEPGPDALDVGQVGRALRTEQVVTAPGAVAVFNPAVVLPALATDVRLVLAPPDPRLDSRYSEEVVVPLREAAEARELAVILVTGLDVRRGRAS